MPGCNGPDRGWDITPRESGQTSVWSTVARWLTDPCSLGEVRMLASVLNVIVVPQRGVSAPLGEMRLLLGDFSK